MNRLVVCAITVLAVGVAACSSDNNNGAGAGLGTFSNVVMTVDSSPITLHVYRNPADTIPKSDTAHYKKGTPYYLSSDAVTRFPTVTIQPQGTEVPNAFENISQTFSNPIVEFDANGDLVGDSTGTTVLTYTFTDYNHGHSTQSTNIPITVVVGPPPPPDARIIKSERIGPFRRSH